MHNTWKKRIDTFVESFCPRIVPMIRIGNEIKNILHTSAVIIPLKKYPSSATEEVSTLNLAK